MMCNAQIGGASATPRAATVSFHSAGKCRSTTVSKLEAVTATMITFLVSGFIITSRISRTGYAKVVRIVYGWLLRPVKVRGTMGVLMLAAFLWKGNYSYWLRAPENY